MGDEGGTEYQLLSKADGSIKESSKLFDGEGVAT